ncbi:hypothetical protein F5Y19DRAFT_482686 [Xylariaceae sp. FL1651]|nr:hypothetical protein F5Y19DRAFT_482686 [Xylariaceae sp. FL1651]
MKHRSGAQWLTQAAQGKLGQLAFNSAQALAQFSFGKSHKVANLEMQSYVQYGKCLQDLARELGSGSTLSKTQACELVVPILVLMMHASTLTDRAATSFHVQGLAKIIALCGPRFFQRQPLLNALEASKATLVVVGLITQRTTFLEGDSWQSIPYALSPEVKTPQSYLLDILAYIPGLLEKHRRLILHYGAAPVVSPPSVNNDTEICSSRAFEKNPISCPIDLNLLKSQLSEQISSNLRRLYRWRWHWQAQFGTDVSVDEKSAYKSNYLATRELGSIGTTRRQDRLRFARSELAADIMLYNAVLMWLLALLNDFAPLRASSVIERCAKQASYDFLNENNVESSAAVTNQQWDHGLGEGP